MKLIGIARNSKLEMQQVTNLLTVCWENDKLFECQIAACNRIDENCNSDSLQLKPTRFVAAILFPRFFEFLQRTRDVWCESGFGAASYSCHVSDQSEIERSWLVYKQTDSRVTCVAWEKSVTCNFTHHITCCLVFTRSFQIPNDTKRNSKNLQQILSKLRGKWVHLMRHRTGMRGAKVLNGD